MNKARRVHAETDECVDVGSPSVVGAGRVWFFLIFKIYPTTQGRFGNLPNFSWLSVFFQFHFIVRNGTTKKKFGSVPTVVSPKTGVCCT